jgi:hypothetical protein
LLHEEIISTIKLESFTNTQQDEVSQSETGAQAAKPIAQKPNENIADLEKKIEALNERNLELQQELTMLQMQESQEIASAKPIGQDELRMEFLNFTSAHIQQFNTRIKKTEELIETQIQKNQQTAEKKSKKGYPVWLLWTNIFVLGLIAIYFLIQMFSGNGSKDASAAKTNINNTVPAVTTSVNGEQQNNKLVENTGVSENTVAATPQNETAQPISTPFHSVAAPAITAQSLEDKNTNAEVAKPAVNNIQPKPAQIAPKQNIAPEKKVVKNIPAVPQTTTPKVKAQPEYKPAPAIAKSSSQPTASVANTRPQTEKKTANKEKVYFGED